MFVNYIYFFYHVTIFILCIFCSMVIRTTYMHTDPINFISAPSPLHFHSGGGGRDGGAGGGQRRAGERQQMQGARGRGSTGDGAWGVSGRARVGVGFTQMHWALPCGNSLPCGMTLCRASPGFAVRLLPLPCASARQRTFVVC
jgi:hypothetical protein